VSHVEITRGSIETLLVDIDDSLGNLTTLVGAGCVFDVKEKSSGTAKMSNVAIQTFVDEPMRAGCRIDTTLGGLWNPVKHLLYVKFTANPDAPILGGMEFSVNP